MPGALLVTTRVRAALAAASAVRVPRRRGAAGGGEGGANLQPARRKSSSSKSNRAIPTLGRIDSVGVTVTTDRDDNAALARLRSREARPGDGGDERLEEEGSEAAAAVPAAGDEPPRETFATRFPMAHWVQWWLRSEDEISFTEAHMLYVEVQLIYTFYDSLPMAI